MIPAQAPVWLVDAVARVHRCAACGGAADDFDYIGVYVPPDGGRRKAYRVCGECWSAYSGTEQSLQHLAELVELTIFPGAVH